jgi:hypothetical protein
MAEGRDLREQMRLAARWLLSQPPVDLTRLARSDIPLIAPQHAERIKALAYRSLMVPLQEAYRRAEAEGAVRPINPDLFAGAFLAMIDGVYQSRRFAVTLDEMPTADELIDMMLNGLAKQG